MTEAELDVLSAAREVRIETSAGEGAPAHRTTIWVVVDERDRVLIRTYRGSGSRWYREALSSGRCRLLVEGRAIDFRVEVADDPERIAACSAALADKYRGDPSTPDMLRDDVLGTTLQLNPT